MNDSKQKRLAIIGAGSSGLITLKYALEYLPDWEIICFEKGVNVRGCWGFPYKGFVSTSTKFTTQFACYQKYSAICKGSHDSPTDFFLDGEYGDYLEEFADHFDLKSHIRFNTKVERIEKNGRSWRVNVDTGTPEDFDPLFDCVFVCSGLADLPKALQANLPTLKHVREPDAVRDKKVVIVGGGESAVDTATRLAHPDLNNQVWLSLRSGIRVSPRYHPIRGVPSDFLRNRLLLSISPRLRNPIGGAFVRARVRHQKLFEKLFPGKKLSDNDRGKRAKEWDLKLMAHARDRLFNVFHTKSELFLDHVDTGRIQIVGEAKNKDYREFNEFGADEPTIQLEPDIVIDQTGYRHALDAIGDGSLKVPDFYRGCIHKDDPSIFLIGFARPVIGNIPTIAEIQAQYTFSILSGRIERPADIEQRHQHERTEVERMFPHLPSDRLLPVEMFPYLDDIARDMGIYPTPKSMGSMREWIRMFLSPASTLHYLPKLRDEDQKRYLPGALCIVLLALRGLDLVISPFAKSKSAP